MHVRRFVVLAVVALSLGVVAVAQDDDPPLSNWTAAPYWNPGVQRVEAEPGGRMIARAGALHVQGPAPAPSPLPFVAVTPCRIVDTRLAVSDGFHEPNFSDDEARTFNFPSSPDCTGLPATAGAYSINVQFRPMTQLSFLTAYPTGVTMPLVSTLTAGPAGWVGNAAIVPAGTGGAIDIYCQYAGRVIIDINGYYASQSLVSSLTGGGAILTGDVTLLEGSNITINPEGNALTIAATGGPGGELPIGSSGQTLYNDGLAWTASSALTNDGTDVAISGRLALPTTTATAGQLTLSGIRFLHAYGANTNTFAGFSAGNFTSTGSDNTGVGGYSLSSNTKGIYNTGSGAYSLWNNTEGNENTAIGLGSMAYTTTGSQNTAVGASALLINETGQGNTAVGRWSLNNSHGSDNIAIGAGAGYNLQTGSGNIYIGNAGGATDEATTIRIGTSQDHTYIAGIYDVQPGSQVFRPVIVDENGQLGTQAITIGVKQGAAANELSAVLLNELQKLRTIITALRTDRDAQLARIEALERQVQMLMEARLAAKQSVASND